MSIGRLRGYRATFAFGLLLLVSVALVPSVFADQVFHTQRITLMSTAGAPLQSGFVVDTHANGPEIFAIERYILVAASPNKAYQVDERVFGTNDSTCSGGAFVPPGVPLHTDAAGNGESGITITPAQIPPSIHNTVFSVRWQVVNLATGAVDYQTACTVVAAD